MFPRVGDDTLVFQPHVGYKEISDESEELHCLKRLDPITIEQFKVLGVSASAQPLIITDSDVAAVSAPATSGTIVRSSVQSAPRSKVFAQVSTNPLADMVERITDEFVDAFPRVGPSPTKRMKRRINKLIRSERIKLAAAPPRFQSMFTESLPSGGAPKITRHKGRDLYVLVVAERGHEVATKLHPCTLARTLHSCTAASRPIFAAWLPHASYRILLKMFDLASSVGMIHRDRQQRPCFFNQISESENETGAHMS